MNNFSIIIQIHILIRSSIFFLNLNLFQSPLLILLPSYAYLNALISLVEAEFAEVENIYQWKVNIFAVI